MAGQRPGLDVPVITQEQLLDALQGLQRGLTATEEDVERIDAV